MDADPTTAAVTKLLTDENFMSGMASNGLTVILLAGLWGLKKLCTRPSKCKTHLHTCCIDIDVADRTGDTIRQLPVSSDERLDTSAVTGPTVHQKPVESMV